MEPFTEIWSIDSSWTVLLLLILLVLLIVNQVRHYLNDEKEKEDLKAYRLQLQSVNAALKEALDNNKEHLQDVFDLQADLDHLVEVNSILQKDIAAYQAFNSKYIIDVHEYYDDITDTVEGAAKKAEEVESDLKSIQARISTLTGVQVNVINAVKDANVTLADINKSIKSHVARKKLKRGMFLSTRTKNKQNYPDIK